MGKKNGLHSELPAPSEPQGLSDCVGPEDFETIPRSSRWSGSVKSFNSRTGFGFIDSRGFGRDIFVHTMHLVGRVGLATGESVEFELFFDKGRPQARNVRVVCGSPVAPAVTDLIEQLTIY